MATRPTRPTPTPIPAWAPVLRGVAFRVGDGLGGALVWILLAAALVVVVEVVAVEEKEVDEEILELLVAALAVMLK